MIQVSHKQMTLHLFYVLHSATKRDAAIRTDVHSEVTSG